MIDNIADAAAPCLPTAAAQDVRWAVKNPETPNKSCVRAVATLRRQRFSSLHCSALACVAVTLSSKHSCTPALNPVLARFCGQGCKNGHYKVSSSIARVENYLRRAKTFIVPIWFFCLFIFFIRHKKKRACVCATYMSPPTKRNNIPPKVNQRNPQHTHRAAPSRTLLPPPAVGVRDTHAIVGWRVLHGAVPG